MTGFRSKVANSSEQNSLLSLLSIQETLQSLTGGTSSAVGVLPDLFVSIIEAFGSQDGRIAVLNVAHDPALVMSLIDGQLDIETYDSLPDNAHEALANVTSQHGQPVLTSDTRKQSEWFFSSHPQTAKAPWSAISTPIRGENSVMGLLTVLREGSDQFGRKDSTMCSLIAGQIGSMLTAVQLRQRALTAEHRSEELHQENQELAAILVHDLQGPLGNVLTSLETVQDGIERLDDSSLSLMMDIAVRSSKHLQALVDSLLDISRLETGQKITDLQPVAISDIIDYVAEVEGPNLEQRRVTLIRNLNPDLPLIRANADILQRVLLNLLDNALKVSKQNQAITIRALFDDSDGLVRMHVEDQGPGIPPAYRERIFEKYQRVNGRSASKGLGLGLAFCKLAVQAHGGQIWVEDSPNGGACFCITIPAPDHPIQISSP